MAVGSGGVWAAGRVCGRRRTGQDLWESGAGGRIVACGVVGVWGGRAAGSWHAVWQLGWRGAVGEGHFCAAVGAAGVMAKHARRLALLEAGGELLGTGSPCVDCGTPRTVFNTGVCWSDASKTRLTFHYAVCDPCRSARACKRLRDDPAAKLVQIGADAAARTKRTQYGGEQLSATTHQSDCEADARAVRPVRVLRPRGHARGRRRHLHGVARQGGRPVRRRCSALAASASSTTSTPPLATRL